MRIIDWLASLSLWLVLGENYVCPAGREPLTRELAAAAFFLSNFEISSSSNEVKLRCAKS